MEGPAPKRQQRNRDIETGEKKGAMQRLEEVIPGEGTASKSKGPGAGSRLAGDE